MYTLGGFNISNLMGIKRGMINIGRKITLYFLQNVWKCAVFSHFHTKFAKSTIMTQNNFFPDKYQYGYRKTQNLTLISNSLMQTEKKAPRRS